MKLWNLNIDNLGVLLDNMLRGLAVCLTGRHFKFSWCVLKWGNTLKVNTSENTSVFTQAKLV